MVWENENTDRFGTWWTLLHMTNKIERECLHCGKHFFVYPCRIRRGTGKYCSTSCGVTHRNLTDNPSRKPETRAKIREHHANVSGENNPMYGVRGRAAPGYIDGRNNFVGETYRRIMAANGLIERCELCGSVDMGRLHIHHKNRNRKDNRIENLMCVCIDCHNNILHKRMRDACGRFIKESDRNVCNL